MNADLKIFVVRCHSSKNGVRTVGDGWDNNNNRPLVG